MQNIIKATTRTSSKPSIQNSNTIGTRSCKALSNFLETTTASLESFSEDFPILPFEEFPSNFPINLSRKFWKIDTFPRLMRQQDKMESSRCWPGCLNERPESPVDYKRYETNWFGHYPILFISLIWFLSLCGELQHSVNKSSQKSAHSAWKSRKKSHTWVMAY